MKQNNIIVIIVVEESQALPYGAENEREFLKIVDSEHMECYVRSFTYYGKKITQYQTLRSVCHFLADRCENDSKTILATCNKKMKNLALERETCLNEVGEKTQGHMKQIEEQMKATKKLQIEGAWKLADVERDQLTFEDLLMNMK